MSDYESSILQELNSIGQATGSAAPVDPVTGNEQIAAAPSPDDYEASIFKELSGLNPNAGAVPRTPQKQVDIHPDVLSSLVISAQRGAGANRDFEKDLTTLDDADLVKIYGQGADALRSQMYNELKAQQKTLNADRTTAQIMGDTVNKAAQSAIGFIGGVLSLSAGAGNYVGGKINDGLGIEDNTTTDFADSVAPAISDATNTAIQWLDGFTSDVRQENARLVQLNIQVDAEINKSERDAAIAAGGNSTFENMKMIGKNFLDAGVETLSNPMATSDLIAGALGSLGPSAKVVGSVAKMVESTGTYKMAQLAAAIDNTGMGKILSMAANATKAGATAGAVGLTEAAGTYQQTLQEVLDMPEEDLMKSAKYFHLVENGMNPTQARTQVAERTAREAFFTALPLATATSIMALKFDANPLKAMGDAGFQNGLAGIGREVLGQTVEEALQSGSSEFSRNLSFQENINPAQELFTGVGEQAAAGAIGGAGMAGVVGIPSAAGAVGNIAADNLSGPAAPSGPTPFGPNDPNSPSSLDPALSAALLDKAQSDIAKMEGQIGPLTEYQKNVLQVLRMNQDNPDNLYQLYVQNDRSPAAEKAFNESIKDVTPSSLTTFMETAKAKAEDAAVVAKELYSKVSASAAEGFAKAKEAVVEKANEYNTRQTSEAAAATVQAAANSVIAVYDWNTQTGKDAPEGIRQATASKAEDVPTELQDTLSSAPDVVSTVSSLVQHLTTGTIKVKDLSDDALLYANEHFDKLRNAIPTMPEDVKKSVQAMLNSPRVAQIQNQVKNLDLSSKVDASVSAIKRMAKIDPSKINLKSVKKILEHRDQNDLTDADVQMLETAAKIASSLNNHEGYQVEIGKDNGVVDFTKPVNEAITDNQSARVSRSLQIDGFNGLPSLNDFASQIFRAAQSPNGKAVDKEGELVSGQNSANRLGLLAQHMINKVAALNESASKAAPNAEGKMLGPNIQFESLNAKSGKLVPAGSASGAKSVALHPGDQNSIKNAQDIYNDAKATVEVYNTLVDAFPQFFPDGKKILSDLSLNPKSDQAKAEPKPAQTEAKPKAEAKAGGEAGATNQETPTPKGEIVFGENKYPKGYKTDAYTIKWDGPIIVVHLNEPVHGIAGFDLDGKRLTFKTNRDVFYAVEIQDGGIDVVVFGQKRSDGTRPTLLFSHSATKEYVKGAGVDVQNDGGHALSEISKLNGDKDFLQFLFDLNSAVKDGKISQEYDYYPMIHNTFKVDVVTLAIAKSEWSLLNNVNAQNNERAKNDLKALKKVAVNLFPVESATAPKTEAVPAHIQAEVNNVASVLEALGLSIPDGEATSIPNIQEFQSLKDAVLHIRDLVLKDSSVLVKELQDLKPKLAWVKKSAPDEARKARALKSAEKYGDGNPSANLLAQLAEELVETMSEIAPSKALDIQKLELKVFRFGPDTVIKDQNNPYNGLTNAQALAKAKGQTVQPVVGAKLTFNEKLPAAIQKKDQAKADKATKFIGRGSKNSSTNRYRISFGDRANTGSYTSSDVVFISAEGQRDGRVLPNYAEIQLALDAGATIITDVPADRARAYNSGERDVASYLETHGYQETAPGTWNKIDNTKLENLTKAVLERFSERIPEGFTLQIDNEMTYALAATNRKTHVIRLNVKAIMADFENGLTYIDGLHGSAGSEQKAEVFKNIDRQAFKDFVLGKGIKTYLDFIMAHELAHVDQIIKGIKFPSDLKDSKFIELEREANAAGFKAIGFNPEAKPTNENTTDFTTSPDSTGGVTAPAGTPEVSVAEDTIMNDKTGLPVLFFHGTTAKFDTFKDGEAFFTNQYSLAVEHATRGKSKAGARVIGANLVMKNPLFIDAGDNLPDTYYLQNTISITEQIASGNHDGLIIANAKDEAIAIVYKSEQITTVNFDQKTKKQVFEAPAPERNDLFKKVFTESKTPAPAKSVEDLLNQVNDLGEEYQIFTSFVQANLASILKTMNARLQSVPFASGSKETVLEAFRRDPAGSLLFGKMKVFAFVDPKTGRYDPHIGQMAIALVLDALSGAYSAPPSLLRDRMEEDGIRFQDLTEQQLSDYMQSISIREMSERLARDIPGLLGLDILDTTRLGDARGVTEDLIKEILTAIAETNDGGLVRLAQIPTSKGYTQGIVLTETMKNLQKEMGLSGRSGVTKLIHPENLDGPSLNAPPEFVAQKQTRGGIETSTEERQVLRNMESIGHSRTPVADLVKFLGKDIMFAMLGGKDPSHLNEKHPLRRSIEGKNLSILRDLEDSLFITQALEDAGPGAKVFYPMGIARQGRHGMKGPNPQNNKILRHSATATWATLDMRNNPIHQDYFWLTVAQAGLGAKVEKKNHADLLAKTETEFRTLYRDAIYLAREFLITEAMDVEAFQEAMMQAGEVTMAAVDAVMAVAALDEARATGTENQFETSLSFEIDGLANGPSNMLVNFGQGLLNVVDYENFRRAGFFIGERNMTTNAYYGEPGAKDLYEVTTQFAQAAMILNKNNHKNMQAVVRFASRFGNFEINKDPATGQIISYTMTRNTAKKPVTKKVYGSGVTGIAKGIADDMVLEFYRAMVEDNFGKSEEMQAYPEFAEDFKLLFNDTYNPEDNWATTFFDKASTLLFQNVVEVTLGKVLTEGSEKMLGQEIKKVTDTLVFATNVQGRYLQLAFDQRVKATLDARLGLRNDGKEHRIQELTVGELKSIIAGLKALAPVYYNGVQSLGLGAFENQITEKTEFSSNLDGHLRMKSSLPMPADVGVKAIPNLNMGRGDAMMMNLVYGKDNFPTKSLPVYDGANLAIDMIGEYSDLFNQAVAESWQQNLLGPVLEDLKRFSMSVPANEQHLLEQAFYEVRLTQSAKAPKFRSLEEVVTTLTKMEAKNLARKNVFEKIPRSVNQMAGADRPVNYGPEGFLSLDEINKMISEEMLNPSPRTEEDVADPKNEFTQLTEMKASDMLNSLLRTVKNKRLLEVLKTLRAANPQVRVVTGNRAQIAAHRVNEGRDVVPTLPKGNGFFDLQNLTIYLISKNHETLVHELVHFTTFFLVQQVYEGKGSEQQRSAVTRLEKLRSEFMDMDFSKASKRAQKAARSAKAQITEHMAKNDAWSKAAALNEFMAWSLANEALAKELGNTLAEGVLRFAKLVKALMARLLGVVAYDMFSNVLFNTRAILEPTEAPMEPAVDPVTNAPSDTSVNGETIDGEVLSDPEVEADIFGQGGFLIPYDNDGGDIIGGGGNGNGGGDGSSNDPSGTPRYDNFWINLLRTKLNEVVALKDSPAGYKATDQYIRYRSNALKSFEAMLNGGFQFSEEQKLTYMAIHMILALEIQLDARALASMNKVFDHMVNTLRPEMFLGEAQDKYQSFMDALGRTSNDQQISDAIATFFAMSQTNDEFRFVLEHMPRPEGKGVSSFAEFVSTMAVSVLRKAIGQVNLEDKSARAAMDMLSRVILAQDVKQEFTILRTLMSSFDVADKYVSGKFSKLAWSMNEYANNIPQEQRIKSMVVQSVAGVTNLLDDTLADNSYEFIKLITHMGNTFDDFVFVRELIAEFIGTDKNNEKIIALLDVVKKQVAALRQGHRDNVPLTLQGNFDNKPTPEQWKVAHGVLAKTDFSALFDLNQADTTMSLISDDAYRTRQIKIYTDTVKRELGRSQALEVLDKAQQLANFMNGHGAGFQLLRNAFAINEISGDPKKPGLVIAIDKLVSLLALEGRTPEDRKTISDMYAADPKGVKNVLVYMQKLNQEEEKKLHLAESIYIDEHGDESDHDPIYRMKINGYKGYVPDLGNPDVTITVENDLYEDELKKRGFFRVGDYTADKDSSVQSFGYYVSNTKQGGGYAQGVMQNIQNTYRGVNAGTGITVNGTTSGILLGHDALDRINRTLIKAGTVADPKEVLLPVFDKEYGIVYYERALNPDLVEKYSQPQSNLALMLGVWSGRQVEEKAAQSYNALLIDHLKQVWDKRPIGQDGMFIDIRGEYYKMLEWDRATDAQRKLMKRPDPIYADSWKVIPPQTKAYIAGVFGADGFMVRKDQINTALGYAEPNIADFWTGKTRFSEGTQAVVRAVADRTLGRLKNGVSAMTMLQTGSTMVQETVSLAKDLIVTRSLVVPYLNSQANIFNLNLRGVPNKMIVAGYRDKLIEIEAYNQNFKKIQFLTMELDLAEGDKNKQSIIRDHIQVLKDQNRRMSIHPLVEAGAYKNISEGITDEDFEILKTGLAAVVEKQIDKLPDIAKTIVKNGLVSQSTDIYKLANKSVQYGDFLAKAVYYDFLTQLQGVSHEDALTRINDEYVNFSTPPGRVRSALDKYGATWFVTYKIRTAKIAVAQARQNPVRALLVNTLDPGHNTMAHSNLFAAIGDGSINYSMGWDMMFNSPGLNPWLNMLGW